MIIILNLINFKFTQVNIHLPRCSLKCLYIIINSTSWPTSPLGKRNTSNDNKIFLYNNNIFNQVLRFNLHSVRRRIITKYKINCLSNT